MSFKKLYLSTKYWKFWHHIKILLYAYRTRHIVNLWIKSFDLFAIMITYG
ncbi:unnamed protein product [Moneuplotes crassus]|uniref:Uncharacterized protein n=1 Tax=Euplotes crassus TaxID=5936 RepID=A0AAD1Y1B7_EUPCR|nr:unnamed protein product [Moneuplotes crassus]